MKVLLDTCVWGGVAQHLRTAGHDVIWCGEWPSDPGDEEILRRAHEESRVLVTLDKDFGEHAVLHGAAHSGIVRLPALSGAAQCRTALEILERYADELRQGALITATGGRARIRLVPPADG